MKMSWHARQESPLSIVEIEGPMGGGPHADTFRQDVLRLAEEGWVNAIFDLSKVRYVYSPGVGMILGAYTSLRNRGGDLKLVVNTERIRNLFHLIQLYKVLDIHEDLESARARFMEELKDRDVDPPRASQEARG